MRITYDADVLIYAAATRHATGSAVIDLLQAEHENFGSTLLLTEVLAKPLREDPDSNESGALLAILSRLNLINLDERVARLALSLAMKYRLRAADAAHLAAAVDTHSDVFLTNNFKDFSREIEEVRVCSPLDLAT